MNRLEKFRADLLSPRIFRVLTVAILMAAVIIIQCLALAAIIFNGPLLPYTVQGTSMMLFGAVVFSLVIGATSSFPGMLAYPQEISATVLGSLGAGIVAGAVRSGHGDAPFMTMVAMLILSGLLTGLFFLAIGRFRLAGYFRFIPYPVAGGFFAGSGCVLVLAALSVMCGETLGWQDLFRLFDSDMVWKWVPGLGCGLVLLIAMNRGSGFVAMMGSVVVLTALYHLGLSILEVPLDEAKARGLLLSGIAKDGATWPVFGLDDMAQVDWSTVARHVPDLLTVSLVTLLCLLVCVDGLEVATGVEVDLDSEFRAAGIANICAGAGGSITGCQSFILSLACRRFGEDTPWIGIVVAAVLSLSLFFGTGAMELLPMSIIGGVLFFIGSDLINTWLVKARKRLSWADYGIIVLICFAITVFGFIEGVGVGMLATLVMFAFRLSREEIVVEEFTARQRTSTRIRSVPDRALLLDRSGRLQGYRLDGYLFFGSVYRLIDQLKQPMGADPRPICIILDFSAVSGCDLSAVTCLCRFARFVNSIGTQLVICAASEPIQKSLRNNLPLEDRDAIRFEADLDHALERGEDAVLAKANEELAQAAGDSRGQLLARVASDLEERLNEQIVFEELVEQLQPWLESREYQAGERLTLQGKVQEGMHLVISGQGCTTILFGFF